jgi:hypothetical protein
VNCCEPHPHHHYVRCDKTAPCYGYHANAPLHLVWPGEPFPEPEPLPEKARTRKGQLAEKAARITDPARRGI